MPVPNLPGYDRSEKLRFIATLRDGYIEEQSLLAVMIDLDTVRLMESSYLFDGYNLLFGDLINVARRPDGAFDVIAPVQPSIMRHFCVSGVRPDQAFTELLHQQGGEWDYELLVFRIHVPVDQLDALSCALGGMDFSKQEELFSGEVNFETLM